MKKLLLVLILISIPSFTFDFGIVEGFSQFFAVNNGDPLFPSLYLLNPQHYLDLKCVFIGWFLTIGLILGSIWISKFIPFFNSEDS